MMRINSSSKDYHSVRPRGRSCVAVCGFTLIELLAVIAIILVVISLLIPVLGLMREKGQSSTCISNQRQLQMGYNFCTVDRNGQLLNFDN